MLLLGTQLVKVIYLYLGKDSVNNLSHSSTIYGNGKKNKQTQSMRSFPKRMWSYTVSLSQLGSWVQDEAGIEVGRKHQDSGED